VSTLGISLLRRISEQVRPPRTYHLRFPFGHALGEPCRRAQQRFIFRDCLSALVSISEPGGIIDSPLRWRRGSFPGE
jgi:D-proline reductase (dithiol) PrdB